MVDLAVAALLLLGGGFILVAGLGLLRMPDVFIRMHASTKAGTLGIGLMLVATALRFGDPAIVARALLIALFVLLTAPVAAHLIARAAYRAGTPLWAGSVIDELRPDGASGASCETSSSLPGAGDDDASSTGERRPQSRGEDREAL